MEDAEGDEYEEVLELDRDGNEIDSSVEEIDAAAVDVVVAEVEVDINLGWFLLSKV